MEEVLPVYRPLGVRQEESLELAQAPTALHPHIAAFEFIPEGRQHGTFVGPAIAGAAVTDEGAEGFRNTGDG